MGRSPTASSVVSFFAEAGPAAASMLRLQRVAAPAAVADLLLSAAVVFGAAGIDDFAALLDLVCVTDLPNARPLDCLCWLSLPAEVGGVGSLDADNLGTTDFFLMGVPDIFPTGRPLDLLVFIFSFPLLMPMFVCAPDALVFGLTPGSSLTLL